METEKKGKEVQTSADKNRQNQTGNNMFRQDLRNSDKGKSKRN